MQRLAIRLRRGRKIIDSEPGPGLSRRNLLAAAAAGSAVAFIPGWSRAQGVGPLLPPQPVRFEVTALAQEVGRHSVDFEASGSGFVARTDIEIDATVLGIRVFRFKQKTSETWSEGRLQAFTSEGDDDGKAFKVSGKAGGGNFIVDGRDGRIVAPSDIMLATYWTPLMLTRTEVINPKKGTLKRQRVTGSRTTTVTVGDTDRPATRYEIVGVLDGAVLYDADGNWVGASFERKGADITYRLVD